MRSVTTFTLPAVTFATLLAVVACGPSKDHVTVQYEGESGFSKAIQSCEGNLKSSQKQVLKQTVKFCRVPETARNESGDATKEAKIELVDQPYFYEVSKTDGRKEKSSRLQVRVKVGLVLPSDLSEKEEETVLDQLNEACGKDLKAFYKRSTSRLPLQLTAAYFIVSDKPTSAVENYNELVLSRTVNGSYPAYEMDAFLKGGKFYPVGDEAEKKRCNSISGTSGDRQTCEYKAFLASNQKFCRQLAKMTGVWLGLTDEATERKTCGLSETSDSKESSEESPKAKRSNSSAFMKSASNQEPAEFFKSASLSKEEIATVLSDSCSGLAQMISPSQTSTPKPSSPMASPQP